MDEEIMQDVKEQLAGALDYDQAAKGVLSQKMVLAYILKQRTRSDMPWSDRIHRRSKGHRMKITA